MLSESIFNLSSVTSLTHLPGLITSVGALGTAAYGLVDATKSLAGGLSNRGFVNIAKTMATLVPDMTVAESAGASTAEPATPPALSLASILVTLKSNWINGMPSADQLAIAKSLVKLRMNPGLAPLIAKMTGVGEAALIAVAEKLGSGVALTQDEADAYGRFDLVLTTLLDQAYQRGDQQYRNTCKAAAMLFAVALAIAGAATLGQVDRHFLIEPAFWQACVIGLLATPLAPVAKDIASAVQAGAAAVGVGA